MKTSLTEQLRVARLHLMKIESSDSPDRLRNVWCDIIQSLERAKTLEEVSREIRHGRATKQVDISQAQN